MASAQTRRRDQHDSCNRYPQDDTSVRQTRAKTRHVNHNGEHNQEYEKRLDKCHEKSFRMIRSSVISTALLMGCPLARE